jgi:hypothetical protein
MGDDMTDLADRILPVVLQLCRSEHSGVYSITWQRFRSIADNGGMVADREPL